MRGLIRSTILGSLLLLLVGCGGGPQFPVGAKAYLVGPRGNRVLAMVPAKQERWSGGRTGWFPDSTQVIGVEDMAFRPGPHGGYPSDAAGPLVRVVVAEGPHDGVEILVSRLHLSSEPRRETVGAPFGLKVLGLAMLALLVAAWWEPCYSWFSDRGRRQAVAHQRHLGGLASVGLPYQRDDERWLAWLQVQRVRQRRQN